LAALPPAAFAAVRAALVVVEELRVALAAIVVVAAVAEAEVSVCLDCVWGYVV
jgi:hypothetical protein